MRLGMQEKFYLMREQINAARHDCNVKMSSLEGERILSALRKFS
jgi:hypothetical protein